jgi:hypothetical protein
MNNNVLVAARVNENKEEAIARELDTFFIEGIFLKPKPNAPQGEIGRFVPHGSIVFADFYLKRQNPVTLGITCHIHLKNGYNFTGDIVQMVDSGIIIKERPLADEISAVKYIPYTSINYVDFTVKDSLVKLDLDSIDEAGLDNDKL